MTKLKSFTCWLLCPWMLTKPNPTIEVIETCRAELCKVEKEMTDRLQDTIRISQNQGR